MGKDKLRKFAVMAELENVIQPKLDEVLNANHPLKGKWRQDVFKNHHPITLELACGKGEFTTSLAKRNANINYIGIDIKGARMYTGATKSLEHNYTNVRFLRTRIDFIESFFAPGEVDEIWITFPDPQPQKPRERKRLTSTMFLDRYKKVLKSDGLVHLKTDNRGFFDYTLEIIKEEGHILEVQTHDLYNTPKNGEIPHVVYETKTHYENLFLKEGKKICYLRFRLCHE